MWGDLWDLPFTADVWGSVSDWVTGLLTAAAVLVAARQYVSAKRFEALSQASQIDMRLLMTGYLGSLNTITITNNSEKPISDLKVYLFLSPVPLVPLRWKLWLPPSTRKHLQDPRETRAHLGQLDDVLTSGICRRLKPDQVVGVDLDSARYPQYVIAGVSVYLPAVYFRDAAGRRWLVDLLPRRSLGALQEGVVNLKQIRSEVPADPHWRLSIVHRFLWRHVLKVPFRRPKPRNIGWLSTAVIAAPRHVEDEATA